LKHDEAPVAVFSGSIELNTRGDGQVIDITDEVRLQLHTSQLSAGIGCVFVPGSTGAITTLEYEPGCVLDLQQLFDKLAPPGRHYQHEQAYHDGNGHSHLRSALLGPSLSFPFNDGQPTLGTWQQIVMVDFDNRPRRRRISVQLVGQ
jgi:secondary thiamine-phosphate synthase enzyme